MTMTPPSMSTGLSNSEGGGNPSSFWFRHPGDFVDVFVFEVEEGVPDTRWNADTRTSEPVLWSDGKQKAKSIAHCLVVATGPDEPHVLANGGKEDGGVFFGDPADEGVRVAEGDVGCFHITGGKYFDWRRSIDEYLGGGGEWGFAMKARISLTDLKPVPGKSPQKIHSIQWRAFDPAKDGDWFDRCIKAHHDRKAADAPTMGGGTATSSAPSADDMPF